MCCSSAALNVSKVSDSPYLMLLPPDREHGYVELFSGDQGAGT